MSNATVVSSVIDSLQAMYFETFTKPEDIQAITTGVEEKAAQGWTHTEMVRFFRNFEEVNPDLAEDKALTSMKTIQEAVAVRLVQVIAI